MFKGVEDGHCFVGDTGVRVDLLQHLVDFFEYAASLDASVGHCFVGDTGVG